MPLFARLLPLLALTMLAACAGGGDPSGPAAGGGDGGEPAPLATHAMPMTMDALFSGGSVTADAAAGCTWFGEGGDRVALVWPAVYRLVKDDAGRLTVADADGRTAAVAGQPVVLTGGMVDLEADVAGVGAHDVPAACRTGDRAIVVGHARPGTID